MLNFSYSFLEHALLYRLTQLLCAPGAEILLTNRLREISRTWQLSGTILDVGCGPASWLWKINVNPVGLDISLAYSQVYHKAGGTAVAGSATKIPFADNSFDNVWSIGVLHHLPESEARLMVQEMHRVCKLGGYVAVLDAVLPLSPWWRPLAYLVRKLDRGKFMRTQIELEAILPAQSSWSINRFTYAINGLEMLLCWNKKTT